MLQKKQTALKPEKIVLTGYKMLKMLKLLISHPQNTNEINNTFKNDSYIQKAVSNDTICLYVNTLRQIGCDISRPCKSNDYKYTLNSHPFNFFISKKNSEALTFVLENLIRTDDWEFLIDICDLFNEIKEICSPASDTSFLRVISDIAKIDRTLIKKLDYYCKKEKLIFLEYRSTSPMLKKITIAPKHLFLENSKLYLWGYNQENQDMQYLRVDRIEKINVVSIAETPTKNKPITTVRYKLINNSAKSFKPKMTQKIIEETKDFTIIEEDVDNKFRFIQTVLLNADECIVISPNEIKEEVISSLKELLTKYE